MTSNTPLNESVRAARSITVTIALAGTTNPRWHHVVLRAGRDSASGDGSSSTGEQAVVMTADELRGIVMLLAERCSFAPGRYVGDEPEYFASIEADQQVFHCPLGLNQVTLAVLTDVAARVAPERRAPIDLMVDDLARLLAARG